MSSMSLMNKSTDTTLVTFFLVATNSGEDIGVLAGTKLEQGMATNSAWFNVDRGDTDTFMVFFVDQSGVFWQSNGEVANLSHRDNWAVSVNVSGSAAGGLEMALNASGDSYGPWPIYKVATVNPPPGGPPSGGNYMNLYDQSNDTDLAVYFQVVTNSGRDIGVLAGDVRSEHSTGFASFPVDPGDTNTFMILFADQNGKFWQSNGQEANLPSGESSTASVIVSGTANLGQLVMVINTTSGSQGPFPIFPVGTVYAPS
jgi:hypothetical protein